MSNQPFATPSFGKPTTWTPTGTFGRYTIERQLGLGGMAQIWRARVDGESECVVLKTALPHLAADPAFSAMFVREAALSIQFSHPNIVAVQDIGAIDGRFFIEMEYVVGRTLRQLMRKVGQDNSFLGLDFVLTVMIDCCNALDYVHSFCDLSGHTLGLVHRDLSPENLMVSASGLTKLLDFGIASSDVASNLTQAGQLKGKLHYMAPEVFLGARPDPQRDIYALGVTLFELLTGRRPFDAKNDAELMFSISKGEMVEPTRYRPDLPAELQQVVLKAMAHEPKARYDSVRTLRAALREVCAALDIEDEHSAVSRALIEYFPRPEAEDPNTQDIEPRSNVSGASALPHYVGRQREPKGVDNPRPSAIRRARAATLTPIPSAQHADIFSVTRSGPRASSPSRSDLFTPAPQRDLHSSPFELYSRPGTRPESSRNDSFIGAVPVAVREPTAPQRDRQATRHFERGVALARDGHIHEALHEWQRAVELDPNNATFQTNVRLAQQRLDDDRENNQR